MKLKSYLFIIVLIIVLAFILGVRYGQGIEKNNKAVDYLLSITPSPKPSPTPPMTYVNYKSKKYGIKFSYPSFLEIKESATTPAILIYFKK